MPIVSGPETAFNGVCAEYDKWRPTYVDALYDDIFATKSIDASSKVLEIGIGTGQATTPILKKNCALTAIELGDQLAEYVQHKFADYPKFNVINLPFQDLEGQGNTYDLIFSASAFHWIPEEVGYPKVFEMLKSGGAFARFANHPGRDKGRDAMHETIQKVYDVYMPRTFKNHEYGADDARKTAEIALKYGFVNISFQLYQRTRIFTAAEYTLLLGTYSDHIAIEETKRRDFFAEIQSVIDAAGGQITIYDTIDLQMAVKP